MQSSGARDRETLFIEPSARRYRPNRGLADPLFQVEVRRMLGGMSASRSSQRSRQRANPT